MVATAEKIKRNTAAVAIQLIDDRVAIRTDKAEERTTGGLYLPEEAQEKPFRGVVVAVGPGKYIDGSKERAPLLVQVGHYVAYQKYNTMDVEVDGEKLTILRQTEILAILPEPKD